MKKTKKLYESKDSLVEATLMALQGKLVLEENKSKKIKKESVNVNVDNGSIDVNTDDVTVSVEGDVTYVETPDASVAVMKPEGPSEELNGIENVPAEDVEAITAPEEPVEELPVENEVPADVDVPLDESKKLNEEVSKEEIEVAEKIADKIEELGIMDFTEVDNLISELMGISFDDENAQDIANDIYGCMTYYNGIKQNLSTGDFYTEEYAEEHPEIMEESKKIKVEKKLNEDDNEEEEEEKEEPALDTKEDATEFLKNDEEEAIDGYDRVIAKLGDYDLSEEEITKFTDVLNHIKDEEAEHIEEIEELENGEPVDITDVPEEPIEESKSLKTETQADDVYENIRREHRQGGISDYYPLLAGMIADIADDMGDDYSEWLDEDNIKEIIDNALGNDSVWAELENFLRDAIEDKVAWIRSDDPASKYYTGDLDESKSLKTEDLMNVDDLRNQIANTNESDSFRYIFNSIVDILDSFNDKEETISYDEIYNLAETAFNDKDVARAFEDIDAALVNYLREEGKLEESKKIEEAENPENKDINEKIRKTLNGSIKYYDDLEAAGLNVFQNNKGKAQAIGKGDHRGMTKDDLKKAHTDMDYYNYMTKEKIAPAEVATGAFTPTNMFRNSSNFEKTVGNEDRTVYQDDANGISKAIPKKYKTGRKNYNYNPDEFPKRSYMGVTSYEPLYNKELSDFKHNKARIADDSYLKSKLDKAKAEYDNIKANYDATNDQVNAVRDRIAKSKQRTKSVNGSQQIDTESFNRCVENYYKNKGGKIQKFETVNFSQGFAKILIEGVITTTSNARRKVALEFYKVGGGRNFQSYQLKEKRSLKTEGKEKSTKTKMVISSSKNKVLECKFIKTK